MRRLNFVFSFQRQILRKAKFDEFTFIWHFQKWKYRFVIHKVSPGFQVFITQTMLFLN